IGVTQFFRDAEAFESLRQRVISPLFVERPVDDPVRVWVAGCATGEEAYSLAMLLDEESRRHDWRGDIKVFATDVHRPSIDSAGRGVYEKEQATGLSEERTERYFLRKKDALQAATPLRQMVVFASHNVLRDAPFTRLDLVTCRNMLIYFRPEAQRKAISLFHFGLRSGGRLMLGPSETPGELSEEFDVVDQRHRLYRKRRDVSLLADIRLSAPKPAARLEAPAAAKGVGKSSLAERQVIAAYEQLSSARLAPSYLVNTRGELVYSTPGASRFLKTSDGFARNKFLDLVHGDLRTPIASLMRHCEQDAAAATLKSVTLGGAGGGVTVEVSVAPIQLPDYDEPVLAVTIDAGDAARTAPDAEQVERDELANERIDHLETELGHTRENLQATIQELETSNEELQAVNEELVASNEELQSTNEELHSVNEELHTINSEHQRKIEELTDLTEDMENLLQSSDSVTLFLDEQLTIRRFAPGAEKVFGILATDIGRGIDTFANTLDYPALFDDLGAAIREDRTIETEAASRGGVHYLVRITPYQSEVGSRGAVLSLVDLSPLRQAREELQASEQLFRGMFENSAVGMARKSLDGSWLNVNSRFCELLGYTREELLARTFRDVTHKDDVAEDTRQIELMASGKSDSYALQKRYLRKDGEVIWVNLTVSLQRSDTGEPLHCISVVQDITQTKRLEEQLREAIGQRDRFLATLSHELRNPLAALLHAARLLDRRSVPEEEGRPLGVILRQSQQMEALLRDLLDVSRVTQDKLSLHRSPVDLVGLARVAAETMAPQMQSHAHEFELDLPEGGVWIDADPTRILQVLENLLSNAARYTPRGGRVTLRLSTQGGAARVEVADTGRGLTPELIDRVFDMFVQSEESERSLDGGMGLGLTLTKSIVEMHGGRVTARSDGEGQGSTFEVLLPETDGRPTPAADHPAVGERVRRVVLVEDEADAREMLAETLELDGFDVATAADGDQGLALIIQELPEVALVDVALPGLTGYEIATQVRKTDNAAGVRLVAMTGYGRDEDRRAALEAGFDDHLVKPVQPADLLRVLTKPKGDA
ncbi:MAG: CheR family methyltransferase, partial [Planctomycetota bacterium]